MMAPDAYIAALVTSVLCLILFAGSLILRAPREERIILVGLLVVMLPMNALAFYGVRLPMNEVVMHFVGSHELTMDWIRSVYAPLTEEPAKLWPLWIPLVVRRLDRVPIHRVALAIGIGFGIGEAWTVASLLAGMPECRGLAWYEWMGYVSERMMVCLMHAGFTASALWWMVRRQRVWWGILVCMGLHYVCNFPITLLKVFGAGMGRQAVAGVMQGWVLLCFLLMAYLLVAFAYGRGGLKKLFRGEVRCPGCKQIYPRPLFGVNLLHKRYEKCPHCRHWHLVGVFDEVEYRDQSIGRSN